MYNLVIGLDISKSTIDATLVKWQQKQVYHDSFLNKKLGFEQLIKWVEIYRSSKDQLLICMEHTGHYAHKLCVFLKRKNIPFAQINPLKIKRSMGLRREKSDKADSKAIAMYGLKFQGEFSIDTLVEEEYLALQLLLAHRKRVQEKQLSFQRQEKYLKHCLSNSCASLVLKHLKKYRTYFKKELRAIESKLDDLINKNPGLKQSYELLNSIPGIGRIISLYTLLYTKNFTQITCPRKFACYCSVAPFKNESGTSIRKGTRVSFYANRKMKGMLNFGAMNAVKIDPQLKAYYQKKVEQKNNKMLVLNAVRNKLIHRMFAVIKRGTPYVLSPTY